MAEKLPHPTLAWHYTNGIKLALILDTGELRPSAVGVEPPEKPILWFSSEPYWEATAGKAIVTAAGELRQLGLQEGREVGRGLFRLGAAKSRLHPWAKLWKKARMDASMAEALAASAREQGANPAHWYGLTRALSLTAVAAVERMDDDMRWVPHSIG